MLKHRSNYTDYRQYKRCYCSHFKNENRM